MEMEMEIRMNRREELDAVVERAKGWRFPHRRSWWGSPMVLKWDGEVEVEECWDECEDVRADSLWRKMELMSLPRVVCGNGRGTRKRRSGFVVVRMRWRRVLAPAQLDQDLDHDGVMRLCE